MRLAHPAILDEYCPFGFKYFISRRLIRQMIPDIIHSFEEFFLKVNLRFKLLFGNSIIYISQKDLGGQLIKNTFVCLDKYGFGQL